MKETRIYEVRAADTPAGDGGMVLTGRAVVFDTPTVINDPAGPYTEVIERGALDGAQLDDSRLVYNHDMTKVPLARTPRTMQLTVGPAGLDMRASLPDTEEARAVYQAVRRGDLSAMSFAFTVPEGGDSYDAATNTRTIHRIAKVYELSIVPFAAYPTTSVEARSAIEDGDSRLALVKKCNQVMLHTI